MINLHSVNYGSKCQNTKVYIGDSIYAYIEEKILVPTFSVVAIISPTITLFDLNLPLKIDDEGRRNKIINVSIRAVIKKQYRPAKSTAGQSE